MASRGLLLLLCSVGSANLFQMSLSFQSCVSSLFFFLAEREAYLVNYGGWAGMLISLVSHRMLASECEKHRVCESLPF